MTDYYIARDRENPDAIAVYEYRPRGLHRRVMGGFYRREQAEDWINRQVARGEGEGDAG
jgi:hypothetical protein